MSTKVRATVESVDIPGDRLTIVLESPYFTTISSGDQVFVELQTLQGTRVEFHKEFIAEDPSVVAEPVQEEIPIEEPVDEVTSVDPKHTNETITTGTDTPSSESVEPVKDSKSSKKK